MGRVRVVDIASAQSETGTMRIIHSVTINRIIVWFAVHCFVCVHRINAGLAVSAVLAVVVEELLLDILGACGLAGAAFRDNEDAAAAAAAVVVAAAAGIWVAVMVAAGHMAGGAGRLWRR